MRRWQINTDACTIAAVAWVAIGMVALIGVWHGPHNSPPWWAFLAWLSPMGFAIVGLALWGLVRWLRGPNAYLIRRIPRTPDDA